MTLNDTPTTRIRAMGATPELTAAEVRALGRASLDGELRRGFARLGSEAIRDGSVHSEPFFVVLRFAPTKNGLAIMGRASQKMVVNIANRGGMCAVFAGRLTEALFGATAL